jgi:hypothetical protein
LLRVVEEWHLAPSTQRGGSVDLDRSSYLVLQWDRKGAYQLFHYNLALPRPQDLRWSFPTSRGTAEAGRRIVGDAKTGLLFEWYGESGGQLKFYPFATDAAWSTAPFHLEPLPDSMEYGLSAKAMTYFPKQWKAAMQSKADYYSGK